MSADRRVIAVLVGGSRTELREVLVQRGLTNDFAPLTCRPGHRHQPGDTIWMRADRDPRPDMRALWCDPCAKKSLITEEN